MPTIGTQLNIMIDPDKRDKFKNKVRGEGRTVNDVINELIDTYLSHTNQPNQPNQIDLDQAINEAIANSPIVEELRKRIKKLENERTSPTIEDIPSDTPESDNNSIEVLSHTDILPSEDCQETTLKTINDEIHLNDSEAVLGEISEGMAESETTENPESPPDTGIEGDDVELAKESKRQKLKLSEGELERAIADKDLDRLLAFPLTGKEGKRELIKNLIPQAMWIKDRFVELEKKHPPKLRPNGQKQSFNYSHLKTNQADEIIKEFCQR